MKVHGTSYLAQIGSIPVYDITLFEETCSFCTQCLLLLCRSSVSVPSKYNRISDKNDQQTFEDHASFKMQRT